MISVETILRAPIHADVSAQLVDWSEFEWIRLRLFRLICTSNHQARATRSRYFGPVFLSKVINC